MSSPSRRDESFDRLLRASLKDAVSLPTHVEAETLAAWADGGLSPDVRLLVETHVSSCRECQMMVAALVRATPEPARPRGWLSGWRLGWLAGTATAAAALTVWFAVSGDRGETPVAQTMARVDVAAPAPPPVMAPPQPPAPQRETMAAPQGSMAQAARQEAAARAVAAAPEALQAPKAVMPPSATEPRGVIGGIAPPPPLPAAPSDSRADASRSITFAPAPAPAPPAPVVVSAASGERSATVNAPATQRFTTPLLLVADVIFSSRQPAPAGPSVSAIPAGRGGGGGRGGGAAGGRAAVPVAGAPTLVVRWRISTTGALSRSTDTGATWESIPLAPGLEIAAGDAPSAPVCWLVGRRGLVLLTTNTGVRFTPLAFPETVDLVEVSATDGREATVEAVDGRLFTTSDAGASWRVDR